MQLILDHVGRRHRQSLAGKPDLSTSQYHRTDAFPRILRGLARQNILKLYELSHIRVDMSDEYIADTYISQVSARTLCRHGSARGQCLQSECPRRGQLR